MFTVCSLGLGTVMRERRKAANEQNFEHCIIVSIVAYTDGRHLAITSYPNFTLKIFCAQSHRDTFALFLFFGL